MSRVYFAYGLIVIGIMGTAQYRGWRLMPVTERALL